MRKSYPTDVVFNDKANSDTQNPIIGTLWTQIELGKLNNEKQIKKQLETALSIKYLTIAEQLKRLSDFNQKKDGWMMMMMIAITTTMVLDLYRLCHCLCLLIYFFIILPHLRYLKTTTTKLKRLDSSSKISTW